MQLAQHKKLYESVLSSVQSSQSLEKALNAVLRLAISDHSHFNFLLHNIHWFSEPYLQHFDILEKAFRIYRGLGKQSERVIYNILTDGMWSSAACSKACKCLLRLIKTGFDMKMLRESLRENYPHKVVQLTSQLNYLNSLLHLYRECEPMRSDILEIIMLQLASFDTELCTGDSYCLQAFPLDQQIKEDRIKAARDEECIKFDILITTLLEQLDKQRNSQCTFKQLIMIFKNDLVLIDQTKSIQFILYYFAEQSKHQSKNFLTFLFSQLLQKMKQKSHHKILTSLNNYLCSFVTRSTQLTFPLINKTIKNLIKLINSQLDLRLHSKTENNIDFNGQVSLSTQIQQINLGKLLQDNFDILLLLQSVIRIWIARPECRQNNLQQFQKLCSRCSHQIYYQYFISHEFIREVKIMNTNCVKQVYKLIEFSHKFNPPPLKRLGVFVDTLINPYIKEQRIQIKLQNIKTEVKQEATNLGMPLKRIKSEKKSSEDTIFSYKKQNS